MMALLDQINTMKPWTVGHKRCPVCGKGATLYAAKSPACRECFLKALEIELIKEDISHWCWERFSLALSSLGTMKDRLLALIHFKAFQNMKGTAELLVENLGFDSDHPLAWYTRQKAYEACVFFGDREKMLKTILSTKKFGSWQQKANMVKVCWDINSESPKVIKFIEQMAADPSPNVRRDVADTILDNEAAWAEKLCDKLRYDKNPLVRDIFERKQDNRETGYNPMPYTRREEAGTTGRAGRVKKQTAPYSKMEAAISYHCDFSMQNQVYTLYLSHLPDLLGKNKYTEKKYTPKEVAALKENTKDACIRLLAAAVSNDFLFNTILEKLPEEVVKLLYIIAWECEECESRIAEKKLGQLMEKDLPPDTVAGKKTPLSKSVENDPAYFMFDIVKNYAYYLNDSSSISINYPLLPFIKKRLPPPAFARLAPLTDIKGRVEQVHKDAQDIFRQLPPILSFIAQDNLKFSKNGKNALKGSLKKMANACGIDEFYIDGDNELKYLKTKLLADFFSCISPWKATDLEDLPGFLKTRINQYFSFKEFKGHSSRSMFAHIKRQMEECDSDNAEKNMRNNFKKVLNRLPEEKWIATCDLAMTAFYDGIHFNPFLDGYEFNSLYITRNLPGFSSRRDNVYLQQLPIMDIQTLPYIKAMMFLMGALGIVELGYSAPENTVFRQYNKPWLSIYDGLKYVKLTGFGSYVTGRETRFTPDITTPSAEIEIDEHKTMLSIYGNDPVKQMALAAVGQQITNSTYMVGYPSFLKDCSSRKDVENKIQFFRDNIIAEPPPIWERFFNEVLARMEPLEQVPAMSVFRVKPDRELLTLLTSDNILKKYVIRAENHHIVVKTSDVSKVKKRLALFGFFVS
ncbi:HEAT repeat domain-containing protein [Desulfobacter latus]|uniref:Uncharacterized protein n=1 Tax=Desulfobacter latus TaxID=2292 RepID=A0A850SYK0_9BACT|nr:HEAT repeat domain-containing protein [Desulfobacter latus]NWH06384.1 hypothetical protein [Desulfobacter latus]